MKLYVVRNKEGKFFKPVGMGGGAQWQEAIEKAKFYTKIGQAKYQVTWWFKHAPQYGCPELLEFDIEPSKATIIDMTIETDKKIKKKKALELKRKLEDNQLEKERLNKQKKEIEDRLKQL